MMHKKTILSQKDREICEKLGWTIEEYADGTVEIRNCSPCGEDLNFTIDGDDFASGVMRCSNDFDIDDHIAMWVQAKTNSSVSGIPSTRELVEDAKAIQEMLDELWDALTADNRSTIAERNQCFDKTAAASRLPQREMRGIVLSVLRTGYSKTEKHSSEECARWLYPLKNIFCENAFWKVCCNSNPFWSSANNPNRMALIADIHAMRKRDFTDDAYFRIINRFENGDRYGIAVENN